MIYLDNAATSWPKPPEVARAIVDYLENAGGNPGRSGHRLSLDAARIVYDAREAVGQLFNACDPMRVVFTLNATHATNLALCGVLKAGDKVVTTGIEHNAVMRPLRMLEKHGVKVDVVPCGPDGSLSLDELSRSVKPGTRLVAMNHASNVVGTILPVEKAAEIAHAAGALILVDAAQTAGVLPIDVQGMGIDFLAFTGHKGLMGPPGTGGLVIGEHVDTSALKPLICGGTGSRSESEEQPEDLPDRFESGTPNGAGLAGLLAGVRMISERGIGAVRAHEMELTELLLSGLMSIPGVTVYGTRNPSESTATVSFTVDGKSVSEVGYRLDRDYGVLCRTGLHCAPAAHKSTGTFPKGTVRFSPGAYSTVEDILLALDAVQRIAGS